MTEALSKHRLKTWIRLLRVTRSVETELREFLRVEHDNTLPRFDVLAALYRATDGLTMGELSQQLLVSNGNATAVVDRLERDGLVLRAPSLVDRRVVEVRLTPTGRSQFEAQAGPHEARVDELFAGLDPADLDLLDHLLHRLERRPSLTRRTAP